MIADSVAGEHTIADGDVDVIAAEGIIAKAIDDAGSTVYARAVTDTIADVDTIADADTIANGIAD